MEQYLQRLQALSHETQRMFCQTVDQWSAAHRAGNHGMKTLTAYYVPARTLSGSEVRDYLRSRLPDYMLPVNYVALDELPKTITGKVDRTALERRTTQTKGDPRRETAPASEPERRMAKIWNRILNISGVGRDDNFFELGGHSLLATQVLMEIEEQFGATIPLGAIFTYPTVALLCRHLATQKPLSRTVHAAAVPHGDTQLSNPQRRLWYASQMSGSGLEYKIVKLIDLKGCLNVAAAHQALTEIIHRHETLRTCFAYKAGDLVQKVNPPEAASIEFVDLSLLSSESVEQVYRSIVAEELSRPFDLDTGPLVRTKLLQLACRHARLMLSVHHISADGASFGIMVMELNRLLGRFSNGRPSDLHALPAQYRDFALWENEYLDGAVRDRQLSYWKTKLAGLPNLEFKTPRLGFSSSSYDGEIEFRLEPAVTARVAEVCARMQITPFILFVSIYRILLEMHTDARDIAIGTDVANREIKEYADLIGLFVNQVVLRVVTADGLTFRDVCRHARLSAEEAFANKDVPYDLVVHELGATAANRARNPLFRANFSFHHQLPDIAIEGITTTLLDVKPAGAKYDLLLNMEDGPDGLRGSMEYRGAVFDEEAIVQMVEQFRALCSRVVKDVDLLVVDLLDAVEAERSARKLSELQAAKASRREDLRRFLAARATR